MKHTYHKNNPPWSLGQWRREAIPRLRKRGMTYHRIAHIIDCSIRNVRYHLSK